MSLIRAFTDHPASVGESYLEHMGRAFRFGARMVVAGIACLIHGVFPFLFVRTGSQAITELNEQMILKRTRAPLPPPRALPPSKPLPAKPLPAKALPPSKALPL